MGEGNQGTQNEKGEYESAESLRLEVWEDQAADQTSGQNGGKADQEIAQGIGTDDPRSCLLYTSPSPRDVEEDRMPSSA